MQQVIKDEMQNLTDKLDEIYDRIMALTTQSAKKKSN